MIPRTSKICSKSGPGVLLIITKMAQRIQENYGVIFKKYYFLIYEYMEISKKSKNMKGKPTTFSGNVLGFSEFVFLKIL